MRVRVASWRDGVLTAPERGGDLRGAGPHDKLDYGSLSRPRIERMERFLATCTKSESCRTYPRYDHRLASILAVASAWAYSDAGTMSAADKFRRCVARLDVGGYAYWRDESKIQSWTEAVSAGISSDGRRVVVVLADRVEVYEEDHA